MKPTRFSTGLLLGLVLLPVTQASAQKIEYQPEEFAARRQALCTSLGNQGMVLMFGKAVVPAGIRFRQDNDFYYLTGNEDLNAILFMDAASCDATLFLPAQTEREASRDGWNLLYQEGGAEAHGYAAVHPLTHLQEFLARKRNGGRQTLQVRLSESTEVDQSRSDMARSGFPTTNWKTSRPTSMPFA